MQHQLKSLRRKRVSYNHMACNWLDLYLILTDNYSTQKPMSYLDIPSETCTKKIIKKFELAEKRAD